MKNKIILIMSLGMLVTSVFFGCAESGNTIKEAGTTVAQTEAETETEEVVEEYRMRDIEEKLARIYESLEQDLTEEELRDNKIFAEAWSKECKKEDLPVGKKIRIRGIVSDVTIGNSNSYINIVLKGSDDWEYMSGRLQCSFKKRKYPQIVFAERDKNIVIEGIFGKDEKTYGMADCNVISPKIKEKYFINNISNIIEVALKETLTEREVAEGFPYKFDVDIYGNVSNIIALHQENKEEIKEFFRNEENISMFIDMFDYLLEVGNEEEADRIFIFCSEDDINNLQIGSKIYLNATLYRSSFIENETTYISTYSCLFNEPIYVYQ